jgi:hypothetical protein
MILMPETNTINLSFGTDIRITGTLAAVGYNRIERKHAVLKN